MPYIHLTTFIEAPAERVFDLSRSIDLHKFSMQQYKEEPFGEARTGLMEEGQVVTWKAKHVFKERTLKVKITSMHRPFSFIDEQLEGDFLSMKHEHYFKPLKNGTFLIDQFRYELPYKALGNLFNALYFTRYMEKLLEGRNEVIRQVAESDQWKKYIK